MAINLIIGYSYVIEMTPLKNRNIVGTIVLAVDKMVIFVSVLYFKFWGNNWLNLIYTGIFFSAVSLCLSFYMPDSPQFHYDKGNYQKSKAIFK
jgi:hypothetical protein